MAKSYPENSSNKSKPGTWYKFKVGSKEIVMFCCPECGEIAKLDHRVDEYGSVTPSMSCSTKNCSFHEYISLEGWGARQISNV